MKKIKTITFILLALPAVSFSFTLQNITPFPNYSNYNAKDITNIVRGVKKINHKVGHFIGWKNTAFFYFDLVPMRALDGQICISSLKREASKIGWPLEILIIEDKPSSFSIVSKIIFSELYENLIQGKETKQACSGTVHISKYTKVAVMASSKYTFLGKVVVKEISSIELPAINRSFQKSYNQSINSFLVDYRRKLNTRFEDYFDQQSYLQSKEIAEGRQDQGIIIWTKPLDEIFRRNSSPDNIVEQTKIYQADGLVAEVSFGIKNKKKNEKSCVYPVISPENSQLAYVKNYHYEGGTGKGKIAERLSFVDGKINIGSKAKEIIVGINRDAKEKIAISFFNCKNNKLIKKFDFQVIKLPIQRNYQIPVLVWPYQNSWPFSASSQVFENLSSHYSQIAALQGHYVPRSSSQGFDALKFNQFDKTLPEEFDLYLFLHLKNKRWRLTEAGFKTENSQWLAHQQNWANKFNRLVANSKRTIYLALVDEPHNDQQFTVASTYYDLFKDRPDNLKIFTTLSSGMSVASILKVSSMTDVLVLEQSLVSTMYLKTAKLTGKEIWLYSSREVGRNRDPLVDYRYLPWKVYINGLQGIGIWNYSSNNMRAKKSWPIDYDISGSHYGVVYINEENVFSSKRWEAFKRGMEDIMIAKNIESKVGKSRVVEVFLYTMKNGKNADYLRNALHQLIN